MCKSLVSGQYKSETYHWQINRHGVALGGTGAGLFTIGDLLCRMLDDVLGLEA